MIPTAKKGSNLATLTHVSGPTNFSVAVVMRSELLDHDHTWVGDTLAFYFGGHGYTSWLMFLLNKPHFMAPSSTPSPSSTLFSITNEK